MDTATSPAPPSLLDHPSTRPTMAFDTLVVDHEEGDMATIWEAAATLQGRLLVATFDPHVTPWVRAVFDPSQRTAPPADHGHLPPGLRPAGYTPMHPQDPCKPLYQRLAGPVAMAAEDHSANMPLHSKGVLLADADGWSLFFDANAARWRHGPDHIGREALFVFARTTSTHDAVRLHASVARRMAQIRHLVTALIDGPLPFGSAVGGPLPFVPTFLPSLR